MTTPKTIEIEIAVLVSDDGKFAAYGYPSFSDDPVWDVHYDMMSNYEPEPDAYRKVMVKATVPLPECEPANAVGKVV